MTIFLAINNWKSNSYPTTDNLPWRHGTVHFASNSANAATTLQRIVGYLHHAEARGTRGTSDGYSDEVPRVYDSTGKYVGAIGALGDGPNEFRRPEHMVRSHDSVLILDDARSLLTVVVPPDTIVRSAKWTRSASLLELTDGSFALTSGAWRAGMPLKHTHRNGDIISEFGDSVTSSDLRFQFRHLAAGSDGHLWTAQRDRKLELQRWKIPGELLETIDVATEYFPPYLKHQYATPETAQSPMLLGIWVDAENMVWLVLNIADEQWMEGFGNPMQIEGETVRPVTNWTKAYDTMILRFDPSTRTIVSQRRFDQAFVQVIEPWEIAETPETVDGWFRINVWRITQPR